MANIDTYSKINEEIKFTEEDTVELLKLSEKELLKARLKEQGLDPAQFTDHLKTFDWGMPPHSGWGLGLDRLMTILVGIDNVREVVLYPRDPDRLRP